MIIYRPHRGSLPDALDEAKEFKSIKAMKRYIVAKWTFPYREIYKKTWKMKYHKSIKYKDIVIDDTVTDDTRCNWHDTRYVCAKRIDGVEFDVPQVIGMCATIYER